MIAFNRAKLSLWILSRSLQSRTVIFQIIMPSACDLVIEDIEDMVSSTDPTPHERQSARKNIIPRPKKKKELLNDEELQADRYARICFI